jgi:hypothetical protein
MRMTAEQMFIHHLAFDYWNHGKIPPAEYREKVMQYITDHRNDFRGAVPQ